MKRVLSVILVALMIGACFGGFSASADEGVSVWDGVVPEANAGYIFSGRGTKDRPYLINSAEELALFAANVRTDSVDTCYKGKHFKLTVDIDLNNHEWYPIGGFTHWSHVGTEQNYFAGYFDGDGHVIKNMKVATMTTNADEETVPAAKVGLFGYICGATIMNIGIESGEIEYANGNRRVGALVGLARYGYKIVNCYNKANITANIIDTYDSGSAYIGGIVGWSQDYPAQNPDAKGYDVVKTQKLIESCYNSGNITVTSNTASALFVGGVAGNHVQGGELVNVWNTGDISIAYENNAGSSNIGGLVGQFATDVFFELIGSISKITYTGTIPATYNHGVLFGYAKGASGEDAYFKPAEGSQCVTVWSERLMGRGETVDSLPTEAASEITLEFAKGAFLEDPAKTGKPTVDNNKDNADVNTSKPAETTAPTTTEKTPTQDSQTNDASNTNDTSNTNDNGCGSVVVGGGMLILAVCALPAILVKKKKED